MESDDLDELLEAAWQLTTSSQNDFDLAGRLNGFFDLIDYLRYLQKHASKYLGEKYDAMTLSEYLDNDVRQSIERETAARDEWLRDSGLKRMQQWRIRQRPLDNWRTEHKARRVDVPVRIINVPAINRCLAGDEPEGDGVKLDFIGDRDFRFIDLIIYSALCSHWDKGLKSITIRRILEHLNPGAEWRHLNTDAFVKSVDESIGRLYDIGVEINGEPGMLLDAEVVGDSIVMQSRSKLWGYADEKSGIISIPVDWLKSGKCRIDWLDRIYVARRVRLANYQDSTMPSKISLSSMFRSVGHDISPDTIISYLVHLARLGAIVNANKEKGAVSWTPVPNAKENENEEESAGEREDREEGPDRHHV